MGDELLPELQGLKLQFPDVQNPEVNSRSNENGLSDWQRFVVKNFFDTQPDRRKAYMKRLGYEVGKDGESYRPIGSDSKHQPIEEDNAFLGFIPVYKVWTPEGRGELMRDIGDITFDVGVEGPITGAMSTYVGGQAAAGGAAAGAGVGTLVAPGPGTVAGGAIGGILGGLSGAVAGGAGGKATAEVIKKGVGDFFLDESVPLDLQQTVYQSLTTGALAGVGRGGSQALQAWRKIKAENLQKTLKEIAVRKSNGTWNNELATDFAQNPEKYTPENVSGATRKLLEFADSIFGTSEKMPHSTRELKGGIAKSKINPLNEIADLEIDTLSKMPEANFTVEELAGTLREKVASLQAKKFRTVDEDKALGFLEKELEGMKSKLVNENGTYSEATFKEGRDFLKRLQNAAFEKGSPVEGSLAVVQATRGLKELADAKAGALGSRLPEINAKRSEILTTAQNMKTILKDGTMQAAFTGRDSIAKQRAQRMFEEADRVLDTNLADGAKTLQFQSAVERLYEAPGSFGSGAVIGDAMREGLKQAPKDAFRYATVAAAPAGLGVLPPSVVPAAGAIGGLKGLATGLKTGATFSSPDTLVKQFSKVKARIDVLNKNPTIAQDILSRSIDVRDPRFAANVAATQDVVPRMTPLSPSPAEQSAAPAAAPQAPELLPELQNLKLKFPPGFEDKEEARPSR